MEEILLIASCSLSLSLDNLVDLAPLDSSRSPVVPKLEVGCFPSVALGTGGISIHLLLPKGNSGS